MLARSARTRTSSLRCARYRANALRCSKTLPAFLSLARDALLFHLYCPLVQVLSSLWSANAGLFIISALLIQLQRHIEQQPIVKLAKVQSGQL